jgi:hypothetical protein
MRQWDGNVLLKLAAQAPGQDHPDAQGCQEDHAQGPCIRPHRDQQRSKLIQNEDPTLSLRASTVGDFVLKRSQAQFANNLKDTRQYRPQH